MKYYTPNDPNYNPRSTDLYFIMEDDEIIYPVMSELIHDQLYLQKIGADDKDYYSFGNTYKYTLRMLVEYEESDGEIRRNWQEIYFKTATECVEAYIKLYAEETTPDGGKILTIAAGAYDEILF